MKTVIALFFTCCSFAVNAQSVIGLSAGNCKAAEAVCNIPNDAGDTITFVYNARTTGVTLVVTSVDSDLTPSTVTYSGQLHFSPPTTHTNTLIVTPFNATLHTTTTAVLSGNLRMTRSGSGRGGWAWHTHWDFDSVVIH